MRNKTIRILQNILEIATDMINCMYFRTESRFYDLGSESLVAYLAETQD